MKTPETVTVVGLGKLGAPLAVCLAAKGFRVLGVDLDASRVDAINERRTPVHEPGLQALLETHGDRLSATRDLEAPVLCSDATFIAVPTPSEPDGTFSAHHVLETCRGIGDVLRRKDEWHLVVVTSTLSPLSVDTAIKPVLEERSGKPCGEGFGLCYNPEFIALGTVICDFLNPDFILIGESSRSAGDVLTAIYERVCENDPPIVRMNFVNAELAKLAVNTFVTTKISFANMLARICEHLPGANVDVVTRALGLDSRIGGKYLTGSVGYGGPCFPRDNRALVSLARKIGAPADIAEATDGFNRSEIRRLADLVRRVLPCAGTVGVLGLTYKPNTDVVEESQGLLLTRALVSEGIAVVVYDPAGMANARRLLDSQVGFASSAAECVERSDVVAVLTPWEEFATLSPEIFVRNSPPRVVVDCWRMLDLPESGKAVEYVPLGLSHCGRAVTRNKTRDDS